MLHYITFSTTCLNMNIATTLFLFSLNPCIFPWAIYFTSLLNQSISGLGFTDLSFVKFLHRLLLRLFSIPSYVQRIFTLYCAGRSKQVLCFQVFEAAAVLFIFVLVFIVIIMRLTCTLQWVYYHKLVTVHLFGIWSHGYCHRTYGWLKSTYQSQDPKDSEY